ncbi:tripartite tricarboxylate transporter substrate-binding protein [Cupriavidus basilensis]
MAHAKPDGHTLLLGTLATHGINPALYKSLRTGLSMRAADFTPIAPLVEVLSNVLTIDLAVIEPREVGQGIHREGQGQSSGKFNYASTGGGTPARTSRSGRVQRAGLDMVHVPYKWRAPTHCRPCSRAKSAASSTRSRACCRSTVPARCACSAHRPRASACP